MKWVKLFLIAVALLGVVLNCGCMGSTSENASGGQQTISGEQVVKSQEVEKPTFSNTVKVRYGNDVFVISKDNYDAFIHHKVPDWAIEKIHRDTGFSYDEIEQAIKSGGLKVGIAEDMDANVVNYLYYDDGMMEKSWLWSVVAVPLDKDAFFKFCEIYNVTDVYLNESKYQKQYEEFLKIGEEAKKWFDENVRGHLIVCCVFDIYMKDIDDSLQVYLLKNGWAFIPKEAYGVKYNGTKIEVDKTVLKKSIVYNEKLVEAQNYAREHKLGIWAIEFPKNENQ